MNKELKESLAFIRKYHLPEPSLAIILGSGLGAFADRLEEKQKIPTSKIPHYPSSTVEGHLGYLVFGKWKGLPLMAVQGRTHFYEGYAIQRIAYMIRIMKELGIKRLLVTNAAGGVNPRFKPGDLMLITDHLNFMFDNPLRGPSKYGGPRWPDMSDPYSTVYHEAIEKIALENDIPLKKGVLYVSSGPSYESAAEVKMIATAGADAVSMSTAPEVIVANQSGMEVVGISCITNMATGISAKPLSHDEVTDTANLVQNKFLNLVSGIILYLGK